MEEGEAPLKTTPHNNALKLTAPLGGRAHQGSEVAAASRSPFGERRRRSLARCVRRL